jgi:hypothetical protein
VKTAASIVLSVLLMTVAVMMWQRWRWVSEMKAQCRSAMPLVNERAPRGVVISRLGESSVDYRMADWSLLEKHFGFPDSETEKLTDARKWLKPGERW